MNPLIARFVAKLPHPRLLVNVACVFALLALALMAWSILDPRPVPVFVAMSVGQVIGTLSLALFVLVVVMGLTRSPSERGN
jgi:hypothetical protein